MNGHASPATIELPISAGSALARLKPKARKLLNITVQSWFVVAVIGQYIFALYVALFYGGHALHGNSAGWNEVLPKGHIEGDGLGNFAVGAHMLLAVVIMVGGPLQLIPKIRALFPKFHRYNGRVYLLTAVAISISGLYMILTRGSVGGPVGNFTISLNAVLIILFAFLAFYRAVTGNIKSHRQWALRLFIAVSGVWFFRIGLMFWIFLNKGPAGFDPETFRGPALTFMFFAEYLLPLAILEVYLWVKEKGGTLAKFSMAGVLVGCTLVTAVGIFAATMGLWLPRL